MKQIDKLFYGVVLIALISALGIGTAYSKDEKVERIKNDNGRLEKRTSPDPVVQNNPMYENKQNPVYGTELPKDKKLSPKKPSPVPTPLLSAPENGVKSRTDHPSSYSYHDIIKRH